MGWQKENDVKDCGGPFQTPPLLLNPVTCLHWLSLHTYMDLANPLHVPPLPNPFTFIFLLYVHTSMDLANTMSCMHMQDIHVHVHIETLLWICTCTYVLHGEGGISYLFPTLHCFRVSFVVFVHRTCHESAHFLLTCHLCWARHFRYVTNWASKRKYESGRIWKLEVVQHRRGTSLQGEVIWP